jgi:hypothetical protein
MESGFGEPHPLQVIRDLYTIPISLAICIWYHVGWHMRSVAISRLVAKIDLVRLASLSLPAMMISLAPSERLTEEQQRILRAHWKWAGGYAIFWIVVTILIFGGVYLMLDYLGADDGVRTQSLLLLATVTLVNTIWRAIGVLAGRIELTLRHQDHSRD